MIDIIDLPDGEAVKGPGLYRMSMAHYHSQACCPGPSISSSGLRTIVNESPYHFWMQSEINPDRYPPKEPGDALVLGRAAHALILGDEIFDDHFIYLPSDAPRKPTAQQINAYDEGRASETGARCVEFWRAFNERAQGRMMLTDTQVEHIKHMAAAINACPEAHEVLVSPFTEISMIWQDVTGVWIKSRPDTIPTNGADFGDLKTFSPRSKNIKRAVHQAITDHHYPMQMALASMGAEATMGRTADNCALVMAQVGVPYTVTPVRIDSDTLYWARVMNRHAIDQFARGMETGEWPQPVEGFLDYSLPPSMIARYAEMQINGDLPNDV